MGSSKNIDYYCQLPFSVELRKRGDTFTLWLRELNLLESDTNLVRAHEKLEIAKREAYRRLLDVVEDEAEIPVPVRHHQAFGSRGSARETLLRPIIATLVVVVAAWVCIPKFIQMQSEDMAKELRRQTPRICDETAECLIRYVDRLQNWCVQNPEDWRALVRNLTSAEAALAIRSNSANATTPFDPITHQRTLEEQRKTPAQIPTRQ